MSTLFLNDSVSRGVGAMQCLGWYWFPFLCKIDQCSNCTSGPELFNVRQYLPYLRTKSFFSYMICLIFSCSADLGHRRLMAGPTGDVWEYQSFRKWKPKVRLWSEGAQLTETGCSLPDQTQVVTKKKRRQRAIRFARFRRPLIPKEARGLDWEGGNGTGRMERGGTRDAHCCCLDVCILTFIDWYSSLEW